MIFDHEPYWKCERCKAEWGKDMVLYTKWGIACPRCHGTLQRIASK